MKLQNIISVLITAACAAVAFCIIHQFSDPTGGDGYYYLKQIEWLGTQYSFYHQDYSFFFFPLVLFFKITDSALLSFQITTTISYFTIILVIALQLRKSLSNQLNSDTGSLILSSIFVILLSFQIPLLKLTFQYAKNGFAMALLLIGVFFEVQDKRNVSLPFFLLSTISHKSFLFLTLPIFISKIVSRKLIQASFLVFIGSAGISYFLFPSLFSHLKSFIDQIVWGRFFFQSENNLISNWTIGLTLFWIIIGGAPLYKINKTISLSLTFFALTPFFPIFSGGNIEIKNRLFLSSFVICAMIYAIILNKINSHILKILSFVLSVCILAIFAFQNIMTKTNPFPWIQAWSAQIKNLGELSKVISPKDELITHHGLQFYIDYKTPIRARSLLAKDHAPQYQIAFVPPFFHLDPAISDEINQIEIINLGPNYGLFRYDEFQQLMRMYPLLDHWRNRFLLRPDFVPEYH